jgi:hypothetical protein
MAPADGPALASCERCGALRDPAAATALTWASERIAGGRVRWLCPDCARRHVRDIEAKLPSEWW